MVLIDFERATLRTQTTQGTVKGTPGYFPAKNYLRDGSTRWDVWALAAMILEADMPSGEYRNVMSERGGLAKAEEHVKLQNTCYRLRQILLKTLLRTQVEDMEGLRYIKEQLPKVSFKRYKKEK